MIIELLTRLRFLIARKTHCEVDEELQFHLEQQIQANIAAGMPPQEARRQASSPSVELSVHARNAHEQRPGYHIETLVQDVRYAIRGFRRNPVFTITIVFHPHAWHRQQPLLFSAWSIGSCFAACPMHMRTGLSQLAWCSLSKHRSLCWAVSITTGARVKNPLRL